ncbi:uncharacterized protein LOC126879553 isoform X2 [Diabrotica virgifera virgifera]|uniref:Uncharacterized protein n=1 Tax=Diabrotica virgifera virgifera TaxID=50390 RepID=A0ABM5JL51_DIAVI|nr:uncharacterized protein LOC126879553 isoform X2 [Diabrotica virgifera virgifera]
MKAALVVLLFVFSSVNCNFELRRYNFCLWGQAGELDSNYRIIVPKLMTYLTGIEKQYAVHYIKCNEMALGLANKDPVQKIWEMEKCANKRIKDNKVKNDYPFAFDTV